VHRGLSCSDADSAVFGAVGIPGWRGGQENQSPSSSLRERGAWGTSHDAVRHRNPVGSRCPEYFCETRRGTRCQYRIFLPASAPGWCQPSVIAHQTSHTISRWLRSLSFYLPQHVPTVLASPCDHLCLARHSGCIHCRSGTAPPYPFILLTLPPSFLFRKAPTLWED